MLCLSLPACLKTRWKVRSQSRDQKKDEAFVNSENVCGDSSGEGVSDDGGEKLSR